MKRKLILSILLATNLFVTTGFCQVGKLRIMSYNIRNAKGMDNKIDYSRIAHIISTVNPEIVSVQELDSATSRSGNTDVLKEVAKNAGIIISMARLLIMMVENME
jgi:hypothetical protein